MRSEAAIASVRPHALLVAEGLMHNLFFYVIFPLIFFSLVQTTTKTTTVWTLLLTSNARSSILVLYILVILYFSYVSVDACYCICVLVSCNDDAVVDIKRALLNIGTIHFSYISMITHIQ
jgi:hypothetical protein